MNMRSMAKVNENEKRANETTKDSAEQQEAEKNRRIARTFAIVTLFLVISFLTTTLYQSYKATSRFFGSKQRISKVEDVIDEYLPDVITFSASRPCSEIGYLDLSSSGTCFKVLSAKKTQPDAMRECTKDGGYLVQLRTAEKLNMVHNVIKDMPDFGFYIDGSDAIKEDDWVLSDGSPFYMNWNPREHDASFKMSEQCLLLQPDGTYNDMNCTWPFPFICERQAMPYL
ncbi:hepatic lectin-like [Saccostrea cucullata]|uniref:hepatic lectin-like n=1 Tax=Saccostrea cuccullata TaxID=36930 RepID=UPI002ED2F376